VISMTGFNLNTVISHALGPLHCPSLHGLHHVL
jgi:hypothetical protein